MQAKAGNVYPRRRILLGTAAVAGMVLLPAELALAAKASAGVDAVRRLAQAASRNAFARLAAPEGFWDSAVARIELPVLFGRPGSPMPGVLGQRAFRDELQHKLNTLATASVRRAAPVVGRIARRMAVADPAAVLAGGPTAATSMLRAEVGAALVNVLIPTLTSAVRSVNDPTIAQAIGVLKGVEADEVGHALALNADNAIWYEIGNSETEIRRDPAATKDAILVAALKG